MSFGSLFFDVGSPIGNRISIRLRVHPPDFTGGVPEILVRLSEVIANGGDARCLSEDFSKDSETLDALALFLSHYIVDGLSPIYGETGMGNVIFIAIRKKSE